MIRVYADSKAEPIRCTNRRRGIWRITWDYREIETPEGVQRSYMEETFDHKPTPEEVRTVVTGWYNEQTDRAILCGFSYENIPVWLSGENQFNYKAAYDLAVQTNGDTLPVVFKFGTDTEPVYKTFTTIEELTKFYTCAMKYIQDTLRQGWKKKDALDMTLYE